MSSQIADPDHLLFLLLALKAVYQLCFIVIGSEILDTESFQLLKLTNRLGNSTATFYISTAMAVEI